jgi:enamine deaminase RidA (YjgF/YER057c/UK114 family)
MMQKNVCKISSLKRDCLKCGHVARLGAEGQAESAPSDYANLNLGRINMSLDLLNPDSLPPPFARYAHGRSRAGISRLIVTSGQLAMHKDGTIPQGAFAQATLCFENIAAILAEAGAGAADVLRVNAFVTDRAHMAGYMQARDAFFAQCELPPASTLVIVSGFTRPEFLVEVEVTAAL